MGILSSIFGGSKYTQPGWMREGGRGLWESYGADAQNAYGPEAYERNVSRYRENYDRNMRNQQAAAGGGLAGRGFRYSGTPLFQQQAAGDMARFQSDEAARLMQERLRAYLEQFGMLGGLQGLFQKQYQPGIMGAVGGLAGMGGFGNLFGGGGGGPKGGGGIVYNAGQNIKNKYF